MRFVFPANSQSEIENGKKLKVAVQQGLSLKSAGCQAGPATRSHATARFFILTKEGQPCRKSNETLAASALEPMVSPSPESFLDAATNEPFMPVPLCSRDFLTAPKSRPVRPEQPSPARKRWVSSNWIPRAVGAAQAVSLTVLLFLLPCATHAKIKNKSKPIPDPLDAYLATARKGGSQPVATTGSLWDPNGRMSDMATDAKARYVGDLVTINIAESTNSAQQESAQTSRAFSATSSLAALLGTTGSREQNLFSPSSNQSLNGKGQTALSTSLTTTLAASVTEILPNGMLVIEARRDVTVTNQKETMILRGIIRSEDLSPLNAVSSTAISHLEVSLKGNGVVSDGTRPPNVVVRVLLRIFGF